MNDLISRQAVIDAITRKMVSIPTAGEKDLMGDVNRIRAEDISVIRRFPSAQPETHEKRTETHSCDCISRQAAIDAIEEVDWFHQNRNKDMVSGANPSEHQAWYKADDIYKTLEALPSAQPERKKGKCVWCSSPYRIEYYWIDKDGCTASFEDEDRHIVATEIAKYCPNCGRPLEAEDEG